MALQAFDLRDAQLLDGYCKNAQEANRRYLHELDMDRMLHAFRTNAGLDAPGLPLGGWEAPTCEVRGHFVGHFLSACALMWASTGDEELKAKADKMIAEMAKCQAALGNGYLSAFPESLFDRLESQNNIPWVPYYTAHKIMAGMFDMYTICGNQQALEILKGMAAYFKRRVERLTILQMDLVMRTEFGGMSEVLHNLYAITRDPDHLALANVFDQPEFLGPLALKHDNLTRIHGNTQIPKICGAARRYELTGEKVYRDITEFFWDTVVHTRCYATGGTTDLEVWGEPNKLANMLSLKTQECCKTHNMLKVTRYLIRWTGDPKYADYYERAFLNGIMGTQHPETGMLIYYVPLAAGFVKEYGSPYDSFWCCYGTGVETFSKQADSIYFHDDGGIYVNLFIPSVVNWKEVGLKLEQQTTFPEQEGTGFTIRLGKPAKFALNIHVPYWATNGVTVKVNGEISKAKAAPTSYLKIEREWRDGDKVEIAMPMSLRAHPMPDDPEMIAIMYGPLVLCGLTDKPRMFFADAKNVDTWVKPVPGKPLTFTTTGQNPDVTLIPFYKIVGERYGVYWTVTQEGSPKHKALLAEEEAKRLREARVIDRVLPGNKESEDSHNLKGVNMASGPFKDYSWRHADKGGWFSWDLKVLPDKPVTLSIKLWGSDTPPRNFDILVDGTKVGTQALNNNKPGQFFDVDYPLPSEMTKDKEKVTVKFQAHTDCIAGGVFECVMLK